MAEAAGIYKALWRPDENGFKLARDIIKPLTIGLALLESAPSEFEKLNATNGWGTYEHFVSFVRDYLEACKANPDAEIYACR